MVFQSGSERRPKPSCHLVTQPQVLAGTHQPECPGIQEGGGEGCPPRPFMRSSPPSVSAPCLPAQTLDLCPRKLHGFPHNESSGATGKARPARRLDGLHYLTDTRSFPESLV